MIIDCHTHIGHNKHIKATARALLRSMDKAHIDKALVYAGELWDLSTERLYDDIVWHQDRLIAVASYDFDWGSKWSFWRDSQLKYLADLYKNGMIAAVKFYTGYYHFMPSDLRPILSKLNEVGCPAIFHMGDCLNSVKCAKLKYAHPLNIDEVAVDYPNMNFIIAHMGFPWHRDAAEVCYKNSNVYADISGFVYGSFTGPDQVKFSKVINEFLDIAPVDRLLFGTDYPISNQASYVDAIDWLAHSASSSFLSEMLTVQYLTNNVIRAFKLEGKL